MSGLQHPQSETNSETQELAQTYSTVNPFIDSLSCDDGWSYADWNDDRSSVGWHEGCGQTYDNSASSLWLGNFDVRAMSSPQRFECVRMNLDTKAAVNICLLSFGLEGAGDGRFYRTASGESISDARPWQFQGHDENGLLRHVNRRLVGVHKV